ncbi:unnamed protein product [Lasius platythorax]|uniref:Uncharacterized protein n=1 Tax=Lasius platythorax TaxID=488582 RepID=A0AAV2N784_9HYME
MENRRGNSVGSRYRCGRRSVVGRAFGNHGIRIGSMLAGALTATPTGVRRNTNSKPMRIPKPNRWTIEKVVRENPRPSVDTELRRL